MGGNVNRITIDFLGMSIVVRAKDGTTTSIGFLKDNDHRQNLVFQDPEGVSNVVPLSFLSDDRALVLIGISPSGSVILKDSTKFVDIARFGKGAKPKQSIHGELFREIVLPGGDLEALMPQAGNSLAHWELDGATIFLTDRLRYSAETTGDTITCGKAKIRASGDTVTASVLSVDENFGKTKKYANPGDELEEFGHFYRLTKNKGRLPKLMKAQALKGHEWRMMLDPGNPICPFGFVVLE